MTSGVGKNDAQNGRALEAEKLSLMALQKLAPEEVEAFSEGISGYVSEAREHLRGRRRSPGSKPGENGILGASDLFAPAVIYVCVALCDAALDGVKPKVTSAAERGVARLLGAARRRSGPQAEPSARAEEAPRSELAGGGGRRAEIVRLGRVSGLSEEQAGRLADVLEELLDEPGETQ